MHNQKKITTFAGEMKKSVSILLVIMCIASTYAQYQTTAFDQTVRTLQVKYANDNLQLQRPFLSLKDGIVDGNEEENTLLISFDQLSHDLKQYSYTIKHLNYDWTQSDISSYEYVEGFTTADIIDYEHSINTQQEYIHYWFTFPNQNMQLTASGNYVLIIYEDGDIENKVAQVCFSVVEPLADIKIQQRSNTDIEFNGRFQQLDIDINTSSLNLRDAQDITVVVRQNNRLDNEVVLMRPTFQEPNRLRYINNKQLIFEGGNEFRHFDTYSTYYAGYHVNMVRYGLGEYHALLDADDVRGTLGKGAGREGTPYITEEDANGQYVVNCEKTDYVNTEAEYMWVHFYLPVSQPIMNAHIFVGGDLFYNQYTAQNLMQYDAEEKYYHLQAYLKQGGYNYMYYAVGENGVATLPLEGSHWQTRNAYSVDVYYRPFGSRYDRLVGKKITE